MAKNLTEIVFIMDRSGSMSGLEADTIGGFNSLIEKQRNEKGKARVSVVLFDDVTEVIYDRVKIKKIEPMTQEQYYVRGCTALLDAIGGAIHHIGLLHKNMDPEKRPNKTLFVITTDGMENASTRYTYRQIQNMIKRQKRRYGWEFLFLGANIDAIGEAAKIGIQASHAVNYECDEAGLAVGFGALAKTVSSARRAKSSALLCEELERGEWSEEIRRDYNARHKER